MADDGQGDNNLDGNPPAADANNDGDNVPQNWQNFVGPEYPHGVPDEPLDTQLRCYSCFAGTNAGAGSNLDQGGQFILPPSILNKLTRLNIAHPWLFHVTNVSNGRDSHCGVLEFNAPEGQCYAPCWMMKNLQMQEGELIRVTSATLPKATYAKLQLQGSADSLQISDPKAVLEKTLRTFPTMTTGDLIGITYNEQLYEIRVLETKPERAVCCIDTDINVDIEYSISGGFETKAK